MHKPFSSNLTGLSDEGMAELERLLAAELPGVVNANAVQVRDRGVPTPTSFSQELLWMLDRATPGLTAYNLPIVRRVRGPLNVAALEQALTSLAARHESLRTHFADGDAFPVQIVEPPRPVRVTVIDVSATAANSLESEIERQVLERIRAPFDLARDAAFRTTLVRASETDHILILESHHIVVDGWSLGIMFRELAAEYEAASKGQGSPLASPALQFGDFAAWQREHLAGPRLEQLLAFWRQQLGDATTPLALPTDYARPAVPTFAGAQQTVVITKDRLADLKRLAAKHDATLYMLLLAAYGTALHRYTESASVLIGSGSAGRNMSEINDVVGYFNNTLVQRVSFGENATFASVLKSVRDSALGAYDHQDIPLEKLVLELRQGEARLAPLFEVVLTMQEMLGENVALSGTTVERFGADLGATKFDITLLVTERDNELGLTARYRTDLFAPDTMTRFLGHLLQVLDSATANSTIRIRDIPLLTVVERAQLARWNDTVVDEGPAETIVELFDAQATRVPTRIAVVGDDESLTYEQLSTRANQLAHHLQSLGVAVNTPVGLLLDRSASAIVALLGILKAGGAYVPLSVEAPASRLATQLAECRATVVVTESGHAAKLPGNLKIVSLDTDRATLAGGSAARPHVAIVPAGLAYVLYTSGSTGTPKGVAVSHANAVHYSRAISRVLGDVRTDIAGDGFAAMDALHFAVASTLAADLGNTSLLPSLMSGGTLHVLAKDTTTEPAKLEAYTKSHALDVLKITPNHLSALTSGKSGPSLAALLPAKWLVVGGEPLRPDFARTILGAGRCRLLNHYGPTETTVGVCTFEVTTASLAEAQSFGAQTLPLGLVLANTHAYVVDSADNELPVGVPGELLLGGAGVAQGYLRRDDLTAERFVQFGNERVYRTGDRVRRLPNGTIEFLGRKDDQVKIRGHRVEPAELEHALRAHPGVAAAVATVHFDASNEPQLVAYAVPHKEGYAVSHSDRPTVERLMEWLAAELPAYMVPSAILLLDTLPLTANGKVDRANLPSPNTAAVAEVQYVAPRTETETLLVNIWTDVLKKEPIGITDNFLALGGHSLMAIRVLGKISKTFGVRLPLRILFETPTIEGLAALVEKEKATSAPAAAGIGASSRDKYRIGQPPSTEGASDRSGGTS